MKKPCALLYGARCQREPLFVLSLLVEFKRCLIDEIMFKIKEIIIAYNASDDLATD